MLDSLHNHTALSDGTQSHLEVLASAERSGFGGIVFTDHDIMPDERILEELRAYRGPVKWALGCEISSGFPRELGGGMASMFHILGLFTDPFHEGLLEHSRYAIAARGERMERMVANLRREGFVISAADCEREAGEGSVGRPHIARALLTHSENKELFERLRADMERKARTDDRVAMRYRAMMSEVVSGKDLAYPFHLLLKDDAFVPGIYVPYLYVIDMDETVRRIRDAGGIAILAHWGTVKEKISADMLKKFLHDGRLDGVEAPSGCMDSEERVNDTAILRTIASEVGCIVTAGVDAHRAEDFECAARSLSYKGSDGVLQEIIGRINPSLKWTNFK